jgi:hypothetical protein
MKNQLINRIYFISIVIVVFVNNCYSQRITKEDAIKIAETISKNILTDAASNESDKITIRNIDTIKYEDKAIGYVFYLNPGGYIIISGFREMVPIFSMSGNGKYNTNIENIETVLKPAYMQKYLTLVNSNSISNNSIERSRIMWNQYLASNN